MTCSPTSLAMIRPTCSKCKWMYRSEMMYNTYVQSREFWDTWLCSKCDPDPKFRTIIAGSREGVTLGHVKVAVAKAKWKIGMTLSGRARGADQMGEKWAMERDLMIECYAANWDAYGKGAGHIRNEVMASHADALIAIWDGVSPGTKHMIAIAKKFNLLIGVYLFKEDSFSIVNDNRVTTLYTMETIPSDFGDTNKIKKEKKK